MILIGKIIIEGTTDFNLDFVSLVMQMFVDAFAKCSGKMNSYGTEVAHIFWSFDFCTTAFGFNG